MATCNLTLDIAGGGDQPYSTGSVLVGRAVPAGSSTGYVDGSLEAVPLSSPSTVLGVGGFAPVTQGSVYLFVLPSGLRQYKVIPATSTATYSALVDVVPVIDPGNQYTSAQVDAKLAKVGRVLPPYVSPSVNGTYDHQSNLYNWKSTNTRRLRAGLGRAMTGGLCEVVVISDSGGAGCTNSSTLTFDRLRAYPISARDELARHGVPVGGTGMVRLTDAGIASDARWAATGVWDNTGKWYAFTTGLNATATFTTNLTGDRVSVFYYDLADSATFTVSINGAVSGAGFTTVTCSGPAGMKMVVLSSAITAGQTVVIKKTSAGGILDVIAAQVWNSAVGGLVVHNLSQSSASASGTGAAAWADVSTAASLGTLTTTGKLSTDGTKTPDLVIIALGGNDHPGTDSPVSTVTAAIATIRARWPSSDCILVAENQVNDAIVTAANWEAFIAAEYALADTLDVPLIDIRARVGNYATTVANGLVVDGQGHLSSGAYTDIGRAIGMSLAS